MLKSTTVCNSTCKGIHQDLPWKALLKSLEWCSSHPTIPASATAMGWSQGHGSSIALGHDIPAASDTIGWEYRPADHLTQYVEEGNVLTGQSQRRISVAEMWEVTAGTQRLEMGTILHIPTPSQHTSFPSKGQLEELVLISWQTQSNWVTFSPSNQLCPTSAYWWPGVE